MKLITNVIFNEGRLNAFLSKPENVVDVHLTICTYHCFEDSIQLNKERKII